MQKSIIYSKSKKNVEVIPQGRIGSDGEYEFALIINIEDKLFKKVKYNPSIQVKAITLPIFNHYPLFIIMLMVDMDDRLIFDSVWNYYDEKYDLCFDLVKTQEEIKIVFHNTTNGIEKAFKVRNNLKDIVRENIKFMKRLKINDIITDFEIAVKEYRNKVDIKKLWYSDIMKHFMHYNHISSVPKREQVIKDDNIYFSIDKDEVDDMNFDRISQTIKVLEECGVKARGKIILTFDGYSNSELEIFEIDEIRNYTKELFVRHRNLFYFLSNLQYCNVNILSCLLATNKVKSNGITFDRQINIDNDMSFEISKGFLDYAEKLKDVGSEAIRLLETLRLGDESNLDLFKLLSQVSQSTNEIEKTLRGNINSNIYNEDRKFEEVDKPVMLERWMEKCNDPEEDCSWDIVEKILMPNGEIKIERSHTY